MSVPVGDEIVQKGSFFACQTLH